MRKTLKLCVVNLAVVILLTSCKADLDSNGTLENIGDENVNSNIQSADSDNNSPYRPPNREIPEEGSITVFESEKTGIKSASGIWVNEENIVVSDTEEHKLVILDKEGNRIKETGKIGGGPLEFSKPTDIYHDEETGYVYILDNGNKRVQILSENLEYIDEIPLPDIELGDVLSYSSVMADKGYVYISLSFASNGDLHIYRISPQDKIDKTKLTCSGTLFKDGADIYIAEMMLVEYTESKGDPNLYDALGGAGQTYLYKLNGIETEKIAPFPYMYTPSDVIKYKDTYYIASSLWNLVESFKLEKGEFVYEETLMPQVPMDKISPTYGYKMALFDNTIYVTNSKCGDIYVIELD